MLQVVSENRTAVPLADVVGAYAAGEGEPDSLLTPELKAAARLNRSHRNLPSVTTGVPVLRPLDRTAEISREQQSAMGVFCYCYFRTECAVSGSRIY